MGRVFPLVPPLLLGLPALVFLLRPHLAAAVGKVAAFVVQLAQDHVVLEEKLVSHAKSLAAELTGEAV